MADAPGTATPAWVEFYFDPMCPWAYQASLWIREVRSRLGVEIRWRFFSLEEVNRPPDKPHPWQREWAYGWSQMRVGALLRRRSSEDVDRWYAAIGAAFFVQARATHRADVHREVLTEAGFDPEVLDEALADPTTSDEVRADHGHLLSEHGGFGVPTLVLPSGSALFGPVITPAPTAERAERLWDLVLACDELPELYELRRPKTPDDVQRIATAFEPYLRARSWKTIENPAP